MMVFLLLMNYVNEYNNDDDFDDDDGGNDYDRNDIADQENDIDLED